MLSVNEYFDGKVKSIGFQSESLAATVGVMAPGEYTFNTEQKETITVVSGTLRIKLPDSEQWQDFNAKDSFVVDAHRAFQLIVTVNSAYLCTYE
jgi:purine/pyrimidine-nucleoside phosphorylase